MKRLQTYTLVVLLVLLLGCQPVEPVVRVQNQTGQTVKLRWQERLVSYVATLPPGVAVRIDNAGYALDGLEVYRNDKRIRLETLAWARDCEGPGRGFWDHLIKGPGPSMVDATLHHDNVIRCLSRENGAAMLLAWPELLGPRYEYQPD
ncbi:hypothetical protein [Chitinilyticum litopenaei]|uniref:hypothetical protein n=1 Tax=Chitinilyticum litopenaei TaxID=1121276 RepID=UPI00048C48D2|nr:hypothetical protein [Chitinilyticum litopenaei]